MKTALASSNLRQTCGRARPERFVVLDTRGGYTLALNDRRALEKGRVRSNRTRGPPARSDWPDVCTESFSFAGSFKPSPARGRLLQGKQFSSVDARNTLWTLEMNHKERSTPLSMYDKE